MSDYIDSRVSPSLHPDTVKSIDGYDDETALVLGPTVTAFDTAYQAVIAVHAAREAAKTNPTWNEAQQVIHTDDLARRKLDQVTRVFDAELSRLGKAVAHLEAELTAPVTAKAADGIARDIRAHAKAMKTEERHKFVQEALDSGDEVTMSSLLGAPSYLSGLTADFQHTYTRLWREKVAPDMAKRLKAMQSAKAIIETRAGLVFPELTKAVGAPPHKAKALREAKSAAERHFVMTSA
jgi:hypothetical protein